MHYHLRPPNSIPLQTENFWALGHQRLNFDGSTYIRHAAPPYSAGTIIMMSVNGRWVKHS